MLDIIPGSIFCNFDEVKKIRSSDDFSRSLHYRLALLSYVSASFVTPTDARSIARPSRPSDSAAGEAQWDPHEAEAMGRSSSCLVVCSAALLLLLLCVEIVQLF